MKAKEKKREVGYVEPDFKERCGRCANCLVRGNHLRCAKHGFAVFALGICRNGFSAGPRQMVFDFATPQGGARQAETNKEENQDGCKQVSK